MRKQPANGITREGFRLNPSDRDYLMRDGYLPGDLAVIEERVPRMRFFRNYCTELTLEQVFDSLRREEAISGLARCAFHSSSVRLELRGRPVLFELS